MEALCVSLNPCIDRVVWYDGDRGKPRHVADYIGGKTINVARMLRNAGVDSLCLTISGSEHERIQMLFAREGFPTVLVPGPYPVRTAFLSVNRKTGTVCQETNFDNRSSQAQRDELMRRYSSLLEQKPKWVVISGGVAGGMEDMFPPLIAQAKKTGASVFLDSYGEPFERALSCGPDYIKPNQEELTQILGKQTEGHELQAAEELLRRGARNVFITLGDKGAYLISEKESLFHPGFKVKAINTIGSGDSFAAFFIYSMLKGKGLEQSFVVANAAGAANAELLLNGRVTVNDVKKILEKRG